MHNSARFTDSKTRVYRFLTEREPRRANADEEKRRTSAFLWLIAKGQDETGKPKCSGPSISPGTATGGGVLARVTKVSIANDRW